MTMKEVTLSAGESRVVVRRQFSSVPMEYRFTARSALSDAMPLGTVEIKRWKTFTSPPVETLPLKTENIVTAGFRDTHVTVTVHADENLILASNRLPGRSFLLVLLIALGVVLVAAIIIALSIF